MCLFRRPHLAELGRAMTNSGIQSAATARVAAEQRRYPIIGRPDRAQQLLAILKPALPPPMQLLLDSGDVAVGEIGHIHPSVRAVSIDRDSAVVLFNTGMMDFVYATCRALSGATAFVNDDQLPAQAVHGQDPVASVARDVAKLFEQWRRHNRFFARKRKIAYPDFPIGPRVHALTETLAKHAELFMLAHELGHIALKRGLAPKFSNNSEINADAVGFAYYFEPACACTSPRFAFAAAIVCIGILSGLERVGVHFDDDYPPQRARMRVLHRLLGGLASCQQHYHELTTIAVGYESMLDHVSDIIDGALMPGTSFPSVDRLLGFLIGALEELEKESISMERFAEDVERRSRSAPPGMAKEALARLTEYYIKNPHPEDTFIPQPIRARMGEALTEYLQRFA
jgi:hypothetical protein